MAEVRADFLDDEELQRLDVFPDSTDLPLILTIRRESDGGRYSGTELDRSRLYSHGLRGPYAFVDLESDVFFGDVEQACRENGIRIIRSLHDFEGVPDKLTELLDGLPHCDEEIPKIAAMPNNTADVVSLFNALQMSTTREKILLGMGTWGFPTRVLAGKYAGFLTYCSPAGKLAAPGHIDPETLLSVYRFREVNRKTDVYGVIGNPVMHSRSPWIHNPALEALNLNAVYVPFQVDDVPLFFSCAGTLDLKGVSVTVPHKDAVRSVLSQCDKNVEAIASCNTAYLRNEQWCGINSDAPGFMQPLLKLFGKNGLVGLRATIVGAGGTARAAAYALTESGASVLIVNRTLERARRLAEQFGCEFAALNVESTDVIRAFSDLIVQTTSCGMYPKVECDPLPFYKFSGDEVAYDVIYTPPETRFLERARKTGSTTINGKEMLLEQAFIQFKYFTGYDYPTNLADAVQL